MAHFRLTLLLVSVVHQTNPRREHDWFHPFHSLAINPLPKTAGEAKDHWFTVFVPVVGGAIASLNANLQWCRQIFGVIKCLVFPWQFILRDLEVAHAITANSSDWISPPSRGHDVPQSTPCSSLGSRKGRHPTRKVMSLCRQNRMHYPRFQLHLVSFLPCRGKKLCTFVPSDTARVIIKRNNTIVIGTGGVQSGFHHLKKCVGLFHAVQDLLPAEEPVTGMFRIGLTHVEAFHIGWIALQFFLEQIGIIIQIKLIKPQTQFPIQTFQSSLTLLHHRNNPNGLHLANPTIKTSNRNQILLLRHGIVQHAL
mmetsp:Transcript_7868/g.9855  ORF Transcript_7868/g.9855 Transcript_7868/m.9855 type:complete len:309 (+) Transcript_7868:3104-4030(+)